MCASFSGSHSRGVESHSVRVSFDWIDGRRNEDLCQRRVMSGFGEGGALSGREREFSLGKKGQMAGVHAVAVTQSDSQRRRTAT